MQLHHGLYYKSIGWTSLIRVALVFEGWQYPDILGLITPYCGSPMYVFYMIQSAEHNAIIIIVIIIIINNNNNNNDNRLND